MPPSGRVGECAGGLCPRATGGVRGVGVPESGRPRQLLPPPPAPLRPPPRPPAPHITPHHSWIHRGDRLQQHCCQRGTYVCMYQSTGCRSPTDKLERI